MTPHSELVRLVQQTREEARALRQSSREARLWTRELIARTRDLLLRHEKLQGQEAKAQVHKQPEAWRRIHALRVEALEQLKRSLTDLENVRMISGQAPELRDLKEEIRKTIQDAEKSETAEKHPELWSYKPLSHRSD